MTTRKRVLRGKGYASLEAKSGRLLSAGYAVEWNSACFGDADGDNGCPRRSGFGRNSGSFVCYFSI